MKQVFGRFKPRPKFIKFGHSIHKKERAKKFAYMNNLSFFNLLQFTQKIFENFTDNLFKTKANNKYFVV